MGITAQTDIDIGALLDGYEFAVDLVDDVVDVLAGRV